MNTRFVYRCVRATIITLALLAPVSALAADIIVPAGGDLQAALDAAIPGDNVLLTPGATYVGNFRLPVHGGTTYVTIRTRGNDAVLPAAGNRITPAHAQYLAKLRSPNTLPALTTAPSAAYWRIMLVEFLGNDHGAGDIIALGSGSTDQDSVSLVPHHLTIDRVYIHGDALMGQKRGINLNSRNTTIVNSHINEIKAVGQDNQAISGSNGPGPFHIENNHLEASAMPFMYGGDDPKIAGLVPGGLTFRRNTLTRPLSWRNAIVPTPTGVSATSGTGGSLAAGTYAYRVTARRPVGYTIDPPVTATSARTAEVTATVGANGRVTIRWNSVPNATEYRVYGRSPGGQTEFWTVTTTSFIDTGADGTTGTAPTNGTVWQVKNLFELKSMRAAQIDYNLMENNWSQAQAGIAVLLKVANSNGRCPQCVVEDVTFEHNIVRNAGGGFSILGVDYTYPGGAQLNNVRIQHNEVSGIDRTLWGGNGYFMSITDEPRDLVVDHNTIISPNGLGVVTVSGPPVEGFVFTNNVARHNSYGIFGNGMSYGNTAIDHYFPDGTVRRNVLAGGTASRYPTDNFFPTTSAFESHFVDYDGANYELEPGTDWANAGTDSEDLGADMAALRAVRDPSGTEAPQILTQSLPAARALQSYSATLQATGGRPPYQWSIIGGSLPAGIVLDPLTGALSGMPSTAGDYAFTARVIDDNGAASTQPLSIHVDPATVPNSPPSVSVRSSRSGVIPVGAPVTLTADASDTDGTVTRVNFTINGQAAGSDTSAPFTRSWTAVDGGPHTARATAIDDDGASTTSAAITLRTTPEIVIYADDVNRIVGDYQMVTDATAAAGRRLWNPNRFATKILTAAASPANYAEFTFYAEAGRPYRLWIRGKGESNLWSNDSAYLQFSGTVDAGGVPVARIDTTGSMWYSVEEYTNAKISGWGWQDNGFGQNVVGQSLYFERTGLQTIRMQPREDGLSIDQIVISPSQYFSLAPGLPKNDATIVAKP